MYEKILPYIWVTMVFGDILTHMYSKFPTTQIVMECEFNKTVSIPQRNVTV